MLAFSPSMKRNGNAKAPLLAALGLMTLSNSAFAQEIFKIDFDPAVTGTIYSNTGDTVQTVQGPVLWNSNSSPTAFAYTLTIEVQGGPNGSSGINFPAGDTISDPETSGGGIAPFTTQGNQPGVLVDIDGRDVGPGPGLTDWQRDNTTQVIVTLSIDGGALQLDDLNYTVTDLDFNLLGESNDYAIDSRFSFIDAVQFTTNSAGNSYTLGSDVRSIGPDSFVAAFDDANMNMLADSATDGRINPTSTTGNVEVDNPGINSGVTSFALTYFDPGNGVEGDADGLHDFDSANVVIGLGEILFGVPEPSSALLVFLCAGLSSLRRRR